MCTGFCTNRTERTLELRRRISFVQSVLSQGVTTRSNREQSDCMLSLVSRENVCPKLENQRKSRLTPKALDSKIFLP